MWRQWHEGAEEAQESIPAPMTSRVTVDNPYEVRRWCQRFVCTARQLLEAVENVGHEPAAVRAQVDAWRGGPADLWRRC
jgi:hypothetical protein